MTNNYYERLKKLIIDEGVDMCRLCKYDHTTKTDKKCKECDMEEYSNFKVDMNRRYEERK